MKRVVIFGTGKMGELIATCLAEDYGRTIAAFTVDREYKTGDSFCGLPLLAFDELPGIRPPEEYEMAVAIGYANLNRTRSEKIEVCASLGYSVLSYISPRAVVPPSFCPAPNVFVFEGAVIQRFASLGTGTIVWPNASICHHAVLEDAVFVGPGATICGGTHIGARALIGAGAVVRDFLSVGGGAIVGAGSVLLRDLPHGAVCNGGESGVVFDKAGGLSLWPPRTTRSPR